MSSGIIFEGSLDAISDILSGSMVYREVPAGEDGTKDYSKLPHMDLDEMPEGATPERWEEYLQTVAALPEVLAVDALFPLAHDLFMAHGYSPEDSVAAVEDLARRARERYPDAKLPEDLQREVDAAAAAVEGEGRHRKQG